MVVFGNSRAGEMRKIEVDDLSLLDSLKSTLRASSMSELFVKCPKDGDINSSQQ